MRWVNHKSTAFFLTFAVTLNVFFSLIAAIASTIPDAVEIAFEKIFPVKHRGKSHNPITWIILFLIIFVAIYLMQQGDILSEYQGIVSSVLIAISEFNLPLIFAPEIIVKLLTIYDIIEIFFLAIFAGIALHLFTDSLSLSGIPIYKKKNIAFKLYKTFKLSEVYVALTIVVISIVVILFRLELM